MSQVMDLKKFRQFNNHDLIELYSTNEAVLNKGTLVEYVTAVPDTQNGFGPGFANVPGYAWSADYEVKWKVRATPSGSTKVAGMLLKDVVQFLYDPWQVDARFAPEEKLAEKQVIPSGRAVPIVTRGIFEITGYDISIANPTPGAGAYVSNSGGGIIAVGNSNTVVDANSFGGSGFARTRVGTFLTSSGSNGAAMLKLEIR